jgi:hypothetical protein
MSAVRVVRPTSTMPLEFHLLGGRPPVRRLGHGHFSQAMDASRYQMGDTKKRRSLPGQRHIRPLCCTTQQAPL